MESELWVAIREIQLFSPRFAEGRGWLVRTSTSRLHASSFARALKERERMSSAGRSTGAASQTAPAHSLVEWADGTVARVRVQPTQPREGFVRVRVLGREPSAADNNETDEEDEVDVAQQDWAQFQSLKMQAVLQGLLSKQIAEDRVRRCRPCLYHAVRTVRCPTASPRPSAATPLFCSADGKLAPFVDPCRRLPTARPSSARSST